MWGHSFLILPGFEGRLSLSSLQGENRSFSHTCLRGGGGPADLKWRLLLQTSGSMSHSSVGGLGEGDGSAFPYFPHLV